MIQEVRVFNVVGNDVHGQDIRYEINRTLGITTITDIRTVKVYRFEGIGEQEAVQLSQALLSESINQTCLINKQTDNTGAKKVEVGYKPGVMNPEVSSLFKAARDLGVNLTAADTSLEYHFYGGVSDQQVQEILDRLLVNKTVERVIEEKPYTLAIAAPVGAIDVIALRDMSEDELITFAKNNQLFLNKDEMCAIQNYFKSIGRDPYDAELETIAQTWSEHCSHKTFKAKLIVDGKEKEPLMTRLKNTAQKFSNDVVSAFVDNAGVLRFYDGYAIAGKVETHNSPSAIEPYGGAATGSGGVFRDIMGTGQGAKVIASTDMFCFAPPNLSDERLPPGCLHPNYLLRRVVAGVRDYGNRMGIPTNNGSVHFHEDFRAKPTVIVGAYGIAKEEQSIKGTPEIGDTIFVVGGRTGRDGIHGATFSSGEMTAATVSVNASAVQIGNPIEEKRTADALLACRDAGFIRAITDCGAGGFSSAIGEMGAEIGVQVELERVPLKYQGLAPWEMWVSESQERMVCAVAPEHADAFAVICAEHNVEATEIGTFTGNKKLYVTYEGKTVCDLEMDFLHEGMPPRVMEASSFSVRPACAAKPCCARHSFKRRLGRRREQGRRIEGKEHGVSKDIYCSIMSHWNICSKEPIVRQYDHSVQGTNVLPPFSGVKQDGPNDAVVLTPLLDKPYGLIISHGMNPILNRIDPYKGSLWAIAEALANLVAVGGNPKQVALIDNFIWPYPDKESLWALDAAIDACVDAMELFEIPFISGKDSLSSTYRYSSGEVLKIPPVLCVSAFGKIPDVSKTITADFKYDNSCIVLVGDLDVHAMGGSAYGDYVQLSGAQIPDITINHLPTIFNTLHQNIANGNIVSCHDISEGGIAVALAEMCFGGEVGATIDLAHIKDDQPDFLFFNETAGCFLVEVTEQVLERNIFAEIPHSVLGKTSKEKRIDVAYAEQELCSVDIEVLRSAWQQPMKEVFHT